MQSESDVGSRRSAVTPKIDKRLARSPSSAMSLDSDTQAIQDRVESSAISIAKASLRVTDLTTEAGSFGGYINTVSGKESSRIRRSS
jgi:hypothetical protein